MDLKILPDAIEFIRSIPLWCRSDDGQCRFRYTLSKETCQQDGYIGNCDKFYCLENGNELCCKAQTLIERSNYVIENFNNSKVTSDSVPEVATDDAFKYIIAMGIGGIIIIVVLVLVLVILGCKLHGKNKQLRTMQKQEMSKSHEDSEDDNDSGLVDTPRSSLTSIKENGLSTSRGSLRKTKIHANPEHHQSRIDLHEEQHRFLPS